MQSCELALCVSTLACCIAEGRSPEEIAPYQFHIYAIGGYISHHRGTSGAVLSSENADKQTS